MLGCFFLGGVREAMCKEVDKITNEKWPFRMRSENKNCSRLAVKLVLARLRALMTNSQCETANEKIDGAVSRWGPRSTASFDKHRPGCDGMIDDW